MRGREMGGGGEKSKVGVGEDFFDTILLPLRSSAPASQLARVTGMYNCMWPLQVGLELNPGL